ncbi:CLUMA_CG021571, isoform A [Clunio marinus]|uniref:CLUMA_CG021571, isoform A n=1 Tax=Clunio marinus TaxID=568069 RepID=A0A1J1JAA6_9DIPT|nr:CLUMA_CG021571, isoform A [Clunio marinus]
MFFATCHAQIAMRYKFSTTHEANEECSGNSSNSGTFSMFTFNGKFNETWKYENIMLVNS